MWRPPAPTEPTQVGDVYVLHFSTPYKHAGHYIGWAKDADARIRAHREGRGGRLTQVAVRNGIELQVAAIHHGVTRDFERRLKNRGGASRVCPICIAARQAAIDAGKARRREAVK